MDYEIYILFFLLLLLIIICLWFKDKYKFLYCINTKVMTLFIGDNNSNELIDIFINKNKEFKNFLEISFEPQYKSIMNNKIFTKEGYKQTYHKQSCFYCIHIGELIFNIRNYGNNCEELIKEFKNYMNDLDILIIKIESNLFIINRKKIKFIKNDLIEYKSTKYDFNSCSLQNYNYYLDTIQRCITGQDYFSMTEYKLCKSKKIKFNNISNKIKMLYNKLKG